jgi:hypothetical protein
LLPTGRRSTTPGLAKAAVTACASLVSDATPSRNRFCREPHAFNAAAREGAATVHRCRGAQPPNRSVQESKGVTRATGVEGADSGTDGRLTHNRGDLRIVDFAKAGTRIGSLPYHGSKGWFKIAFVGGIKHDNSLTNSTGRSFDVFSLKAGF